MIKTISPDTDLSRYSDYKLCFIESIPRTVYDYTDDAKRIMSTPGYTPGSEYLDMINVDNPEYVPGTAELYAYFTPLPLDEQTGPDWNDVPREGFPEAPNDRVNSEIVDIIRIPCAVHSYAYYLPYSWWGECPFSVVDINRGAVAWLYDYNNTTKKPVVLYAGISPAVFVKGLNEISENNPGYTPKQ